MSLLSGLARFTGANLSATMATKKRAGVKKKAKKPASNKRALNKTILSLRKEAAILEEFVAGLSLSDEVPLTRKRIVKKRAKKSVKKKVAKRVVKKRR
ncbi:MAG: hypothetical protein O3A27_06795 [Actinomycetota bacterium]|nr:hypothetical protein [Actinomycetota bacterium]